MADRKISDLTALTAQASGDLLPIVDVSEAAAADKNKSITIQELFRGIPVNVGVGTTSPGVKLHVSGTNDASIRVANTLNNTPSGNHLELLNNSSDGLKFNVGRSGVGGNSNLTYDNNFNINAGATGVATFDSSGRLGVGTSSPDSTLELASGPPSFKLTRNTTASTGNDFGRILFENSAGTTLGSIRGYSESGNTDLGLKFSTGTDDSVALTIDESQRVGIGVTSPINALHINGAAGAVSSRFRLSSTEGSGFTIRSESATETMLNVDSSEHLLFGVGGGEVARIDSSGRVGIGTSSPHATLQVHDGTFVLSKPASGSERNWRFLPSNAAAGDLSLQQSTTAGGTTYDTKFHISAAGNVGIGTTSPSEKLTVDGGICARNASDDSQIKLSHNGTIASVSATYGSTGAYDPLAFFTSDQERARIDSSGRLLVGTSSATSAGSTNYAKFYIKGDAASQNNAALQVLWKGSTPSSGDLLGRTVFAAGTTGAPGAYIDAYADGEWFSGGDTTDQPSRLVFSTTADSASSPTERMRIDQAGYIMLGGGATGQNGSLEVRPNNSFGAPTVRWDRNPTSDGSTAAVFANNNNTVGSITYGDSSTAFNTSSDYRLKENVVDLDGAITRVKQLAPKRFNFIVNAKKTVDGFLAHEAQTVVPEAVTGTHNEVDDDGNPVYQGIDQSKLVPLLTAALQEAIAKIETLEQRLNDAGIS